MIRLLGTKEQRQLKLINIYRQQTGLHLSYKELADCLDCAKGTIVSDLNEISELFEGEILVTQTGTGVHLEFIKHFPESYYFHTYSQNSLNFNLLMDLYKNGEHPTDEVSQRLFVSRSSIYRAMKQINQFLEEVQLNLRTTTAPVGLVGDEISVRLAAPFLFSHYYEHTEWSFSSLNRSEAIQLYELLAENSSYLRLFEGNPLVYLQIVINFDRYVHGHKLASDEWTITGDHLSQILKDRDPFSNVLIQGKEYPLVELIPQISAGLINRYTLLDNTSLSKNNLKSDQTRQALFSFKDRMSDLKEKYHLSSAKEDDIKLIALTIYNLLMAKHHSVNVIVNDPIAHQSDLVQEVAYMNPDYIDDVQNVLREFMTDLDIKQADQEDVLELLVFYYLVIWPNTVKEINQKKKIDLLIYTGNYKYDLEYKASLEGAVETYANIHVEKSWPDWDKILEEKQYQIILSTYYVPADSGVEAYDIRSMPDVETIAWLYKTIRKINDSDISDVDQPVSNSSVRLV